MADTKILDKPQIQENKPLFGKRERRLITDPINDNNPITVQVLGICSALAITTQVSPAVVMTLAVIFVMGFANLFTSLLRHSIPKQVRMIVMLIIIAFLVTVVELSLKAINYPIYQELSVFIGLIITNCIIMGRLEAFAMADKPWPSFLDGVGNAMGYGAILIIVAFFRELFGSGSLMGWELFGPGEQFMLNTDAHWWLSWYMPNNLMVLSASALFVIGILIWVHRAWNRKLIDVS
ncbi:MAG: NADH:ubiquinone reductase (Na(+)-transporting) subunit D [Saprospirales bacterium]|nr:MAG: NADH:ubiquinone reductase (Na(+)-transporting) subunit D [Saprospirales bacterium]